MLLFHVSWCAFAPRINRVVAKGRESIAADSHEHAWDECERRIRAQRPGSNIRPESVLIVRNAEGIDYLERERPGYFKLWANKKGN